MWPNTNLVTFVVLTLTVGLQCTRADPWKPSDPPGESRIEGVTYKGSGNLKALHDRNTATWYAPPDSNYPYFWVDLGGLYNITTIEMLSQNDRFMGNAGINKPFLISTSSEYMHPCRKPKMYDWTVCKQGATFTAKGQVATFKCAPKASVAQYVMFSTGHPSQTTVVQGVLAAEIQFYGEKIRDNCITPEPEDGPYLPNQYLDTRRELLDGVNKLYVDPFGVAFVPNRTLNDVPFVWALGRVAALAAQREKGRFICYIGYRWVDLMLKDSKYAQLKKNVARWLTAGKNESARFVYYDQKYQTGDIVIVKRSPFNKDLIKKYLLHGLISVIFAYNGNIRKPIDDATKLMQELGVTPIQDDYYRPTLEVNAKDMIDPSAYTPAIFMLRRHLESWKAFRTEFRSLDFSNIQNSFMPEIMSPDFQRDLRTLLEKYGPYFRDRCPCESRQLHWENRTRIAFENYNLYTMAQKTDTIITLPGADIFPGLASKTATPTKYRITINGPYSGSYYPTGAFVNAGQVFKWRVISHSHNLDNYYFVIGCSTDNLFKNNPWARWPRYSHRHQLSKEGSYASPFGGVLFLALYDSRLNITVELENVYRHPWFDLRNPNSVGDWDNQRRRYRNVPWMAFMGDAMISCLRVSEVVKMNSTHMQYATQYYDNVIKIMHRFRGTDFNNYKHEVFITDVQISAGWGHAGYPIAAYLPWDLAFTKIYDGYGVRSGMTHEIGHNLQVYSCTLKYGGEVTNNVYHFPAIGHLMNQTAYKFHAYLAFSDGEMKQVADTWKGTEYRGVNLGYYNWLGITFGEGLLANLFSAATGNASKLKTEEDKANFWVTSMCHETQYNVYPWQKLWHFPLNDETRKQCEKYPCFFPEDDMTKLVEDIVEGVISKQPGKCVRHAERKVQARIDLLSTQNTIRPQFTFLEY